MSLLALPWEARIPTAALRHGGGRHYERGRPDSDKGSTDCSRLAFAVLREIYGSMVDAERPALMLHLGQEHFAPVDACTRLGIGEPVQRPRSGWWHLMQGWGEHGGHTAFWFEPPIPLWDGRGIQVQANAGWGSFVETNQTWTQQIRRYTKGVALSALVEP